MLSYKRKNSRDSGKNEKMEESNFSDKSRVKEFKKTIDSLQKRNKVLLFVIIGVFILNILLNIVFWLWLWLSVWFWLSFLCHYFLFIIPYSDELLKEYQTNSSWNIHSAEILQLTCLDHSSSQWWSLIFGNFRLRKALLCSLKQNTPGRSNQDQLRNAK